jgi:hypothetical protein
LPDGSKITLEANEGEVLKALVGGPLTITELRRQSNVDDAQRVLRRIRDKYALAQYITLPGARGNGGYRTTIQDSRSRH